MESKYILLLILISLVILIAVVKIILKHMEQKEVDSILEFINERTKDKEVKQKFNECIKIIEDNKDKE